MRRLIDFWREPGQTVVLTPEEVSQAQRDRDMLNKPEYDLYVDPNFAEHFKRAYVAFSLASEPQFFARYGYSIVGENHEKLSERIAKAYAIHPLPMYVFYFAKILHRAGQAEDAQIFFRRFQKELSNFRNNFPDTFDQAFHNPDDVAGALREAREIAPLGE